MARAAGPPVSRRRVLAGLAAAPALTATPASASGQAAAKGAAEQAQAALKDAKGTKLVILGTAAGPVPGRSRKMTSHMMVSNGSAYILDCGLESLTSSRGRGSRSMRSSRSSSLTIMPITTSSTGRCW